MNASSLKLRRDGEIRVSFFDRWFPQLATAPTIVVMLCIFVIPLAFSLYLSLHVWTVGQPLASARFVGLENFWLLLTDQQFWWSMALTLLYTFAAVAAELVLGFCVALLLNNDLPLIGFFRAALILPMMATPIVAGLTWKLLLDPTYGVVNWLLGTNIVWLGQPVTAFLAVIIVNIWQNTPYVAVLLLAGLRALPKEPFEAAEIDGASRFQVLRYCTLPMMRPFILVALVIRTIFEFRTFDNVYILTGGGPADATMVMSIFTYILTFVSFDLSYGAASSWIMLVVSLVLCAIFIVVLRDRRSI
jgi:multiple sugar transport system permease protein